MKKFLLLILFFISSIGVSQDFPDGMVVVEFNASFNKSNEVVWLPKLSPEELTFDWEICINPPVEVSIANKFWVVAVGTSLAVICARVAFLPEVMTFFQLGIIYGISRLDTVTLPPTSHS